MLSVNVALNTAYIPVRTNGTPEEKIQLVIVQCLCSIMTKYTVLHKSLSAIILEFSFIDQVYRSKSACYLTNYFLIKYLMVWNLIAGYK